MDQMQSFGALSLGSRLKRLSDFLYSEVTTIYEAQGIVLNPTYFPLLYLLYQQGSVSVTQAAELLNVSHPAISRLTKKMVTEEWIKKVSDPHDERRQLLTLTIKSHQLIAQAQPTWHAIKSYLDDLMLKADAPLLSTLNTFETVIHEHGFSQAVLEKMQRSLTQELSLVCWDAQYKSDYERLNREWLDTHFPQQQVAEDQQALTQPETFFLARGGYIWFAVVDNQVVGCCTLAKHNTERYEIAKTAVTKAYQGKGIGRQLVLIALQKTRELAAKEVIIETNSTLLRAMTLYQHLGFTPKPHPNSQSIYPRADIYLSLSL